MIAPQEEGAATPHSTDVLPRSRKVYVAGTQHPDIRVPFREIALGKTKLPGGTMQENEPVRVYDTSGPWGDPDLACDVHRGLPTLRRDWIRRRGDVEEYDGRIISPADNGYLSD